MKSLSRVGLGLSVVFTCLLLALVAEIYYLLWWKRRIIRSDIKDEYRNPTRREFFFMFCWKRPYKSSIFDDRSRTSSTQIHHQSSNGQELGFRGENSKEYCGAEMIISGPPRFLFTIKEETREDLESEDGKSCREKRSLRKLLKVEESANSSSTPTYSTPLSSPPFLTPMGSCHSTQSGSGYNPFNEDSSDAEFSKIVNVKLSPPPKFKFLRDAEEKLQRKLVLMEEGKVEGGVHGIVTEEEDGSFIRIIVAKNDAENDGNQSNNQFHSPHCHQGHSSSSSSLGPSNRKFINFLKL